MQLLQCTHSTCRDLVDDLGRGRGRRANSNLGLGRGDEAGEKVKVEVVITRIEPTSLIFLHLILHLIHLIHLIHLHPHRKRREEINFAQLPVARPHQPLGHVKTLSGHALNCGTRLSCVHLPAMMVDRPHFSIVETLDERLHHDIRSRSSLLSV